MICRVIGYIGDLSGKYSCRFSGRLIGYSLADAVENLAVAVVESVSDTVADAD